MNIMKVAEKTNTEYTPDAEGRNNVNNPYK